MIDKKPYYCPRCNVLFNMTPGELFSNTKKIPRKICNTCKMDE